jgi:tetratricopeptide (TPR) repeat protein
VPLLLQGAKARFESGDLREAERLLRQREQLMHRLVTPDRSLAWGQGWLLRAEVALRRPSYAEARKWALRVYEASQRQGWPLSAAALRVVGMAESNLGSPDQARRQLLRALHECEPSAEERAQLLHELGALAVQVGRLDDAQEAAEHALEEFEQLEQPIGIARCQVLLGSLARQRGDLDLGMTLTSGAARLFHEQGRSRQASIALNTLGEICRLKGDLDSSARHYEQALRTATEGGHWVAIYPRINLALIRCRKGQMAEAQVDLTRALDEARGMNHRGLAALVHACLLPCRAYVGDWSGLERDLEAAQSGLLAAGVVDVDAAWSARRAAKLAQFNNAPPELVSRLTELAHAQWAGLGRSDEPLP